MGRRLAALCLVGFSFVGSGCFVPTIMVTSAIELVDETMSIRLGQECSLMNIAIGEPYCRDRTVASGRPPVYCFKTIGGVDCYADADPYRVGNSERAKPQQSLAEPPIGAVVLARKPVALPASPPTMPERDY